MADLQAILSAIDELPADDFEILYQHIVERHADSADITTRRIIPPESLERIDELMRPVQEQAEQMTEDEVFATIDEAIAAVRHERKTRRSH